MAVSSQSIGLNCLSAYPPRGTRQRRGNPRRWQASQLPFGLSPSGDAKVSARRAAKRTAVSIAFRLIPLGGQGYDFESSGDVFGVSIAFRLIPLGGLMVI